MNKNGHPVTVIPGRRGGLSLYDYSGGGGEMKPRLLDLFCGAGGSARGWQSVGFHVTGVDIAPQPHYVGDVFIQRDALEYLEQHGDEYEAVHASPPCQAHSALRAIWRKKLGDEIWAERHPDLIPRLRAILIALERAYVIENVSGAPLIRPTMLCGTMFGLPLFRHRIFETSFFLLSPPHAPHRMLRASKTSRPPKEGEVWPIYGHFSGIDGAKKAMGIDWMVRDELSQAIPPAYTQFLGKQLMRICRHGCHATAADSVRVLLTGEGIKKGR